MRINKRHIRKVENYLAAVPDGGSFRVVLHTTDPSCLTRAGYSADPASGSTILPAIIGPVSRFNAEGRWKVHRDQPKVSRYTRTIRWRWQQWAGRGQTEEHEDFREIYRECYPRDLIEPPSAELTYVKHSGKGCVASEILVKEGASLERSKHIINLFLELFGSCEIASTDLVSFPASIVRKVNWRMLPPGEYPWERLEQHIRQNHGTRSNDDLMFIMDRQATIRAHGPDEIYVGEGGFHDYVAYRFQKLGLVIMESIRLDNAIYVFGENWTKVSTLTKAEVLRAGHHKARIIHSKEWKSRLATLVTTTRAA